MGCTIVMFLIFAPPTPPQNLIARILSTPVRCRTIKAITKRVIAKHGYRFMVKRRKEPFTRAMLLKMLSKALPAGTRLGPVTMSGKSKAYQSWRCLNAAAAQAGFRKDEMACKTKAQGMTPIKLTRSSLCFLIQGKYVRDPSEAELREMRSWCAVMLEPRPSKADQGGFHWCDKPIFFPWSADDPICAASELIAQELMDPLHGDDRATKSLFSDANGIEERARFGCARAVFTCARASAQMRAHFANSRSGDAHPEKASLT